MILSKGSLIYLIFLAILFVSTIFLLSATVIGIVRQKEAIGNDVARISHDYLQQPSLEEVMRNIERREKDVDSISEKFFVKINDEFEFVKFLENLAGENIKQRIKFDISKKIEEDGYVKVPLEIIAESDSQRVLGYLEKLEKIDYFFEINSISIVNLKPGESETSKIEATVRGFVYWL